MTGVQLDLFEAPDIDDRQSERERWAARFERAEWTIRSKGWVCPCCGDVEPNIALLANNHGIDPDVRRGDRVTPAIGSLCSGYGGLDMAAAKLLGARTAWVADPDPGAALILAHRMPGVPNLGDITRTDWDAVEPVDVLTAGFPCQPVSNARKRKGQDDDRWIWPAVANAVRVLRPELLLLENVAALTVRGLGDVLADLAAIGYVGSWRCVRASDVGAPHQRKRIFITGWPADADREGREGRRLAGPGWWPVAAGAAEDAHGEPGFGHGRPAPGSANGGRPRPDAGGSGRIPAADADGLGRVGPGSARRSEERHAAGADRAAADAARERRGEGRPEPAGIVGRSDVAVGGPAPTDADCDGLARLQERHVGSQAGFAAPQRHHADGRLLDWGPYEPAIRRWAAVLGRPAPAPTEPGRNGQRLSPRFVEWLMGLDEGWVTDVPGLSRNAQLKALGNGVVPQQAAYAYADLLNLAGAAA